MLGASTAVGIIRKSHCLMAGITVTLLVECRHRIVALYSMVNVTNVLELRAYFF